LAVLLQEPLALRSLGNGVKRLDVIATATVAFTTIKAS